MNGTARTINAVSRWLWWLGAKISGGGGSSLSAARRAQVVEAVGAEDLRRSETADGEAHRPLGQHAAGDAGGGGAGPVGVVVGTE